MNQIKLNIPSSLDCCTLFSHFADKPWAMLLDSANAVHVNSRYDLFVWDPVTKLVTTGENTQITRNKGNQIQNEISNHDPLSLLQQEIDNYGLSKINSELPFIGGALGYFGYDLGRCFETMPRLAERDINLPDMAIGIYLWAVIKDNQTGQWILVDHTDESAQRAQQLERLAAVKQQDCEAFTLTDEWQANMSEQQYQEKFAQVQHHLLEGNSYQINLAQRFKASYTGNEWNAYQRLREANKAPFSAFIRLEQDAVISISPERFLLLEENKIETKPIKGTKPRFTDPVQDEASKEALANSAKDRAENLMIVDLLRNDIGKVASTGTVKVPSLFAIESFPSVHHLVTTIKAELADDKTATDLLRGCFPGGSITGAPKIRAMKIIEELEPHRRSVYCGSIGYVSFNGNMDTNITIRTLVCHKDTIYCWAGGGLVYDSNCEDEYQETYHKVAKILPVLTKTESQ